MRSRCTELWFIYTLATLLVLPFSVSSAPNRNHNPDNGEKENVFMQSSPTKSDDDEGDRTWYPTIDLSKDSDNEDYETENVAKRRPPSEPSVATPPVKAKITKIIITKTKKTSPKRSDGKGKSDFKTFCEDGSKGDCSKSKSKPKKQIVVKQKGPDQSCDQIIGEMRSIAGNKDKIETDEVTKLRELIESLSKVMKCGAGADNNKASSVSIAIDASKDMKPQGPIAEIEEKHIVERKIIKADDHVEKQEITNVVDTIKEKTEPPLQTTTTIPATRPPAPPPSTERKNVQDDKNYLGMPADVNYNGGINRPMDELKRMYPSGHWPDQDGDSDEVPSGRQGQESNSPSGTVEYESLYITDDQSDVNEEEEGSQDIANVNDELTPEYLERIIKNERVSSPKKSNNEMNSFHHVEEHKLPIRK